MVDGTLKPYRSYRQYTDAEIKSEQDEYFANDYKTKEYLFKALLCRLMIDTQNNSKSQPRENIEQTLKNY